MSRDHVTTLAALALWAVIVGIRISWSVRDQSRRSSAFLGRVADEQKPAEGFGIYPSPSRKRES
jgi:hypothetical protein